MDVRLADVIHNHHRTQQPRFHLAVYVVKQGMAHALQAFGIACDQLIGQLTGNGDGLLGN